MMIFSSLFLFKEEYFFIQSNIYFSLLGLSRLGLILLQNCICKNTIIMFYLYFSLFVKKTSIQILMYYL